MKRISILILLIQMSLGLIGQSNDKIGSRFYIKTEVLNSLKTIIEPKSYDLDLQISYRISNPLHLVGTYGKTTFYLADSIPSVLAQNRLRAVELIGTANHRSSLMLRYYPLYGFEEILDFIFIEGGFYFMDYVGVTNDQILEDNIDNVVEEFKHELEYFRYGPQLNIGLSRRYGNGEKIIFSPEFFIGVAYNQLDLRKDEITYTIGTPKPFDEYTEQKFRFNLRAKIGIGLN